MGDINQSHSNEFMMRPDERLLNNEMRVFNHRVRVNDLLLGLTLVVATIGLVLGSVAVSQNANRGPAPTPQALPPALPGSRVCPNTDSRAVCFNGYPKEDDCTRCTCNENFYGDQCQFSELTPLECGDYGFLANVTGYSTLICVCAEGYVGAPCVPRDSDAAMIQYGPRDAGDPTHVIKGEDFVSGPLVDVMGMLRRKIVPFSEPIGLARSPLGLARISGGGQMLNFENVKSEMHPVLAPTGVVYVSPFMDIIPSLTTTLSPIRTIKLGTCAEAMAYTMSTGEHFDYLWSVPPGQKPTVDAIIAQCEVNRAGAEIWVVLQTSQASIRTLSASTKAKITSDAGLFTLINATIVDKIEKDRAAAFAAIDDILMSFNGIIGSSVTGVVKAVVFHISQAIYDMRVNGCPLSSDESVQKIVTQRGSEILGVPSKYGPAPPELVRHFVQEKRVCHGGDLSGGEFACFGDKQDVRKWMGGGFELGVPLSSEAIPLSGVIDITTPHDKGIYRKVAEAFSQREFVQAGRWADLVTPQCPAMCAGNGTCSEGEVSCTCPDERREGLTCSRCAPGWLGPECNISSRIHVTCERGPGQHDCHLDYPMAHDPSVHCLMDGFGIKTYTPLTSGVEIIAACMAVPGVGIKDWDRIGDMDVYNCYFSCFHVCS